MMLEIQNPDLAERVNAHIGTGRFHNTDELIEKALNALDERESESAGRQRVGGRKSLAQLFADSPFKGLEIDFGRDSDYGRDAAL